MNTYRRGVVNLPLHGGKAPAWLHNRMSKLGGSIIKTISQEYGTKELINRMTNPYWFQALGNVLGFDFHSSGLTTTLTGALKKAINKEPEKYGLYLAGGKGKQGINTPKHLEKNPLSLKDKKIEELKKASKMTAKADNILLQDNYELYHHAMIIDEKGRWAVIQQGMNEQTRYARRYHWSYEEKNLIEPEKKEIITGTFNKKTLNLNSKESRNNRKGITDAIKEGPTRIRRYLEGQTTINLFTGKEERYTMSRDHYDLKLSKKSWEAINKAYEFQPRNFEELISLKGIGKKTIRALSFVSEIIYGEPADWKDPAKYSFAFGGKDGVPYPVARKRYDEAINFFEETIKQGLKGNDKITALKRLRKIMT